MSATIARFGIIFASLLMAAPYLEADQRVTLTGKVVDATAQPVANATVLVYEAGVKKGYSAYCPTCWTDCGKRALTDPEGNYRLPDLSADLIFTLLVVHDGHSSTYVRKVNPDLGPAETVHLKNRTPVEDTSKVVRGRVVNAQGQPVRDAVVEQQGVTFLGEGGRPGTQFGGTGWIDLLAVTNDKGEFEIAYGKPAQKMILQVRPRAMAPALFTLPTGAERQTVTVRDGASIRGRLLYQGKPVTSAQMGLMSRYRYNGMGYSEVQIGTNDDGRFTITNVPAGRIFYLYPKMESLAARAIGGNPIAVQTKDDGQTIEVGDIELSPAYRVRGKVALVDGKPIPPNMHVTLGGDRAFDNQIVPIASDGSFEFLGIPKGAYDLVPGVKGYQTASGAPAEILVDHELSNVVIRLEPLEPKPTPRQP